MDASERPELGIGKLSLTEAANLLAVDMYGSGLIEKDIPGEDDFALSVDDPIVLDALANERKMLLERIIESVSNGSIKVEQTKRDLLTGVTDPEQTILDYDDLHGWLESWGYAPGDWIKEYLHHESEIREDLAEALCDIRNLHSYSSRADISNVAQQRAFAFADLDEIPELSDKAAQELREIIKGYAAEVAYLRGELRERGSSRRMDALHPKSRNTLNRLILALCIAAKINPAERGAAAAIAAHTQRAGVPVGDDTIRKILDELPEVGSG